MEASIAILLGGRAAEEIFLGSYTTGASNDLERTTDLARKMVCEWGMSKQMGPLTFGKKEEQIFLGREIAQHQDYSEETAVKIDQEVKVIVLRGYTRSKEILESNREAVVRLTEALLEFETLDAREIEMVIQGEKIDRKLKAPSPDAAEPRNQPRTEKEERPFPPLVNPKERPAPA